MPDDNFYELALKVLAGEASTEQTARLHELVRSNPDCGREFDELRSAWRTCNEILPLTQAMDAPPSDIPPRIMARLKDAVRGGGDVQESPPLSIGTDKPCDSFARASEPVRGHKDNFSLSRAAPAAFAKWLSKYSRPFGLSFTLAASTLTLVVTLGVLGAFWFRQRAHETAAPQDIDAYLILEVGHAQVLRGKTFVTISSSAPLAARDKVRLDSGTLGAIITEHSQTEVAGPSEFTPNNAAPGKQKGQGLQRATPKGLTEKTLHDAVFARVDQLNPSALLLTTRDHRPIPLYSPLGATGNLLPIVSWKNEPGKRYDLEIVDEFPPKQSLLRLTSVVSPVELSNLPSLKGKTLAKRGLYRIILKETDQPLSASEFTFETRDSTNSQESYTPGARLAYDCQFVISEPSRAREILYDLLSLPSPWDSSELALRLKLFIFGQLAYVEDFEGTKAELLRIQKAK
jgi:hypothetical protein